MQNISLVSLPTITLITCVLQFVTTENHYTAVITQAQSKNRIFGLGVMILFLIKKDGLVVAKTRI